MSVGILGTGFFVPSRTVTNAEIVAGGLDTTDDWIVEHTGIRARRIAAPHEATSDMATCAAKSALASAFVGPQGVATVVCATSTPDHPLPSTASLIQHRLGSDAAAFDLNAGCSGFAYALLVGFAMQRQSGAGHVLVIGADTYSRCLDWTDRTSAFFFGDGAGAAVLGPTAGEWLLASVAGSDGGGAEDITIPAGGSRIPTTEAALREQMTSFRMRGKRVWEFVRERLPGMIREVVRRAGVRPEDVSLVIPHQANEKLLRTCMADLAIGPERLFVNVAQYANTASASLAIALAEAVQSRRVRRGDIVVLAGFGAGLSWAALCLQWGGR